MPETEYYLPREIRFTRRQLRWLGQYYGTLLDGKWPSNPRETGYTDAPLVQHSQNNHAPFETPIAVVGELDARLHKCGQDGEMWLCRHWDGWDDKRIARLVKCGECEVHWRVVRAEGYMAGWKRKPFSYRDYVSHRR